MDGDKLEGYSALMGLWQAGNILRPQRYAFKIGIQQ